MREIKTTKLRLKKERKDATLDRYIGDLETKEQDKKKEGKEKTDADNPVKEVVMEPVIYKKTPWWLVVKKIYVYDDVGGITEKPVETVFELMEEQGLWKCIKCANVVQSIIGKPVKCSDTKCGSTDFTLLTEVINSNRWKLPTWKDIPAKDLDMEKVYDDMLALVKKCVIFPEFIHYKLFVLWIISSWKVESWSSVGFLTFKGPDGSGKTRALDLIGEMGYRMAQTLGTASTMSMLTHFHNAGLLIDEAGDRLDRKTESGRDMLEFIKTSYRRGSTYATADKNDQDEIISYRTFGFKSLAGETSFDALLSLSIDITMAKDYPAVDDLIYVQDELDDVQTKLLNYRYKTPTPPDLGERFTLRGRTREVYGNIISTAKHVGVIIEDILEYVERREKEREKELQNTLEWEILTAISSIMEEPQYLDGKIMEGPREYISFSDIRERIYGDTDDEKETQQGLEQEIGDTLENSLFVKAKKTKMGMVVPINDPKTRRRLIYLFKTYNIKIEAK